MATTNKVVKAAKIAKKASPAKINNTLITELQKHFGFDGFKGEQEKLLIIYWPVKILL